MHVNVPRKSQLSEDDSKKSEEQSGGFDCGSFYEGDVFSEIFQEKLLKNKHNFFLKTC